MFRLFIPFLALLIACSPMAAPDRTERRAVVASSLPPMKSFAAANVQAPQRSNRDMAQDFLDLSFRMESGRNLPSLTRFEGLITVRVIGERPASLDTDLARLLDRLRREARINITRVSADQPANITIQALPQRDMQRIVPQAACFVVPRVTSWAEFKRYRRNKRTDWTTLTVRQTLSVFVPSDESPQELRDCLHEELAQALGPLNDLYRLPDSIFNDDNFHTVLTGFDMLILRAYYAPELQNGMSANQVATVLPDLLARLNPAGQRPGLGPFARTPRDWTTAIESALGRRSSTYQRKKAALKAIEIAQREGWSDSRRAFSNYVLGRVSIASDIDLALASFLQANAIYASKPTMRVQEAHVAMQLAAFALSSGEAATALELTNRSLKPVSDTENAALLATLLLMKAEALEMLGRSSEARNVRLDSLGWARYGFGSETNVRQRQSEIAALVPRRIISKGGNS